MKVCLESHEEGLSVIIPADLAERAELEAGGEAEMRVASGGLEIFKAGSRPTLVDLIAGKPNEAPSYTVEELMEGFTEDQRHPEWNTGPSVGAEAW